MNKAWSELNKTMQVQLKKQDTYKAGIAALFDLRNQLMQTITSFLRRDDFDAIPFMNAAGYHSKTIAYSLWHIFRIEDIVAHTLIRGNYKQEILHYIREKYPRCFDGYREIYINKNTEYWKLLSAEIDKYCTERNITYKNYFYHNLLVAEKKSNTKGS